MTIVEETIGYIFKNQELIKDALRHSSIKKYSIKFERLEFLGDRILGLVIAEYIYKNFKKNNEGDLAKIQASFVCAKACYEIAKEIGIDKEILTAGEDLATNKTVLSDATEAVLGAVFLDAGFEIAKEIILKLWANMFKTFDISKQAPKAELQELSQAKDKKMPSYELLSISGPSHCPVFEVSVSALGKEAKAIGSSKKIAETLAAKKLLELLQI
ncbi:ribonuclease 3 [Alphaproteobacteria bacterium]|nr:ribonuclease 3 [Alphaproteobacteria bacterium]